MLVRLAFIVLGLQISVAQAADGVPDFDTRPSCTGAARASVTNRDMEGCMRQEREAREQLVRSWSQFAPADRTSCQDSTSLGGIPSYVEFLTCLEIARDVKNARKDSATGVRSPE
ncbi:MAG: hypothetical protein AB7K04_11235 [Pseudorhodoplanes sp.]